MLGACLDDRITPAEPDTTGPVIAVVSPTPQNYDEDGDRLVDVHLAWADADGALDLASARIRALDGVNGPAADTTNLLSVWRVARLDDSSLLVHETLDNLLHGGQNRLEISIADTAGNVATDTISVTLPHGAFIKTLVTGMTSQVSHGIGLVVCTEDQRAYMTAGRNLVVVDANSLVIVGIVPNSQASDDLQIPLCVPGDPILYVTQRLERFDRPTMQWAPRPTAFGAVGIIQSRSDPNILYVGESIAGTIGIIDRSQAKRVGQLLEFSSETEFVFDLAVLTADAKLYATRYADGGILIIEPRTNSILGRIAVGGPTWPDLGRTDAIVLSADDRWLYAAVLDGDPRGVVKIDTRTDSVVRTLPLLNHVPQELALSPSERRMFVTTQDRWAGVPSQNVLVDVVNWTVLQEFPRPRPPGEFRFDGGVAFHPNGKLIFVGHNLDVGVYLSRE